MDKERDLQDYRNALEELNIELQQNLNNIDA